MTLWTKQGTLTKDTTTGSHTQTFTNLWTEAPKILFIWASKNTSDATFIDGLNYSFGWSDGTTSACMAQGSQDNIATQNARATFRNDAIVDFVDETGVGTTQGRATVSSITSTDLVLQWATGTTATQYLMKYFAVGGSDITNAKAINTTIGTTGTGNTSYTGFGFDPTFCMVMSILDTTTAFNAFIGGSSVSLGAGLSSTNRWVIASKIRNGTGTNDSNLMTRADSIAWTCGAGAADTVTSQADLNAFVTDGVQLNIIDAWAASTCPIAILGVRGGLWDIGTLTQRSGSGTQNISTTANRDPEGIMLFNTNTTTLNTITNNVNLAIGANDGTNEGHVVVADVSGSDPMVMVQKQDAAKVISHCTANATAASSTVVSEADTSDMTTPGQFGLNWTTADSTARYLTYISVSKLTASQSSTHKYSLLNNVLQSGIHKYHILQEILQTSIHKYNVLGNAIADSIHKYNVLGNAIADSIHKYNVLAFAAAAQSIHKYHLFNNVVQQTIHKYHLFQNAVTESIHKYNVIVNAISDSIHKYNVLNDIAQQSIHKFHLSQNVVKDSVHKFHILVDVVTQSIHKYNVLADVVAASIHKYHVLDVTVVEIANIMKYHVFQNALQESIHKYNVLQYTARESIHKYNVLAIAAAESIHKYNVLGNAIADSIHKYNILQAAALASIHKYHIRADVAATSIHPYVIGKKVKKLISALGSGKAIELSNGAKLLQQFIKDRWPLS